MTALKRFLLLVLMTFMSWVSIFAANGFVVRKIRVDGLQRISLSTVLSYLPIKQGQVLQPDETGSIVSALYSTGFFSNVTLARDGNDLVINVQERPTIGSIKISGNKKVQTKKLEDVLKSIGLQEGNIFDSSILLGLKQSLEQQYESTGQYNATVTTDVIPQSRNRVAIDIKIDEGKPAHIKSIKIVGNHAFSQRKLLWHFKMTTWRLWTIITHSDQYSQEKMDADVETLSKYYMDRGYARFKVNSANANMSPDKKTVNIVIDITEGSIYHIKGYQVSGNLLGQDADVQKLISANLKPGDVFSRQKILDISEAIKRIYGNQGYAFGSVNPVPVYDDNAHLVSINFIVDPGRRVYVRQINFTGNTKTQEIVLRRQMRQEEGGLYNYWGLEEGKRLLQMLGFLQNVTYQTVPVPGHPDQVDINYNVTEMSSATASVQVGYSDLYGLLYGANITESNLLGTGKQISLGFQNSEYSDMYSLTYTNPYYTESGISRSITVFSSHVTPNNVGGADYTNNATGINVNYALPISEYSYLTFGYGYQYININPGQLPNPALGQTCGSVGQIPGFASTQICNFITQHGSNFNQTSLNAGWQRTTYDRALLPTQGTKQVLTGEVGVPILNNYLEYYRLNYEAGMYQPLGKGFILHLTGDAGYGYGYGAFSDGLPFFKNYFAGGIGTVRGYRGNTLGPQDSQGNPIGGNVLTLASVGLIIPNPISDKLRTSVFVDGGNVFANQFALSQVRYSAGIDVQFYIPMVGPLEFAIAEPINKSSTDQGNAFDFSVGTSF